MPIIEAILKHDATEAKEIIRDAGTDMRMVLADVTGYNLDDIALMLRILSEEESRLSQNIPPLALLVDLGSLVQVGVNDAMAEDFKTTVVLRIRRIKDINFVVWIRSYKENGFSEHAQGE